MVVIWGWSFIFWCRRRNRWVLISWRSTIPMPEKKCWEKFKIRFNFEKYLNEINMIETVHSLWSHVIVSCVTWTTAAVMFVTWWTRIFIIVRTAIAQWYTTIIFSSFIFWPTVCLHNQIEKQKRNFNALIELFVSHCLSRTRLKCIVGTKSVRVWRDDFHCFWWFWCLTTNCNITNKSNQLYVLYFM